MLAVRLSVTSAGMAREHKNKIVSVAVPVNRKPRRMGAKVMKPNQLQATGGGAMKIAVAPLVLFLSLAASGVAQACVMNALPNAAVSSTGVQAPKGVKVLARVPLDGQPVTRMYTQWESGRTYLYIEHGREQPTTVDVTRKRNPKVVNHEPVPPEPARYEELAEGGTIEVSPPWHVNAGLDNVGGRGTFSILQVTDPDDAALLQTFGHESSDLADRDRNLIFFASPSQLLVVEDGRWKGMDYTIN